MVRRTNVHKKTTVLTWKEFDEAAAKLAKMIKKSGKVYSGISGIERGGLPLAVKLSNLLNLPYIRYPTVMAQSHALLIDDISDGGKTLAFYKKKICHPQTTFVTWVVKKNTKFIPDFYVKKVEQYEWVVFPWEE